MKNSRVYLLLSVTGVLEEINQRAKDILRLRSTKELISRKLKIRMHL